MKCQICGDEVASGEPKWYLPHDDLTGHKECLHAKYDAWLAEYGAEDPENYSGPYQLRSLASGEGSAPVRDVSGAVPPLLERQGNMIKAQNEDGEVVWMNPPTCECGHGFFEHYPPSITKGGVSCLHTTFGSTSVGEPRVTHCGVRRGQR